MLSPCASLAQIPTTFNNKSAAQIQWLTPIEVIRNIDQILALTRLEAGRGDAFSSKINVAKSFAHAGDHLEAKNAYAEAIAIAWKRQIDNDLLSEVENELDRSKKSLVKDTRPSGLDENYQPIEQASSKGNAIAASINKYEAGKKLMKPCHLSI